MPSHKKISYRYVLRALLVSIFLCILLGCEQEHRRAIYTSSETDSLEFLVSNSDTIVHISIFEGIPDKGNVRQNEKILSSAKARCVEVYKGNLKNDSIIMITSSTVYNKPGSVETFMYLRNSDYIAFLKKIDDVYKPLTPYSLIEIHFEKLRAIWKQKRSKFIDIPDTPKSEIISEIKNTIKHMK